MFNLVQYRVVWGLTSHRPCFYDSPYMMGRGRVGGAISLGGNVSMHIVKDISRMTTPRVGHRPAGGGTNNPLIHTHRVPMLHFPKVPFTA